MRILHTADLHLGKTVNEFSMLEDQKFLLQQLLDVTAEKKVDAVVISGDIYDRSVPPEDAVSLLDGFLTALSKRGIPVLLVSGIMTPLSASPMDQSSLQRAGSTSREHLRGPCPASHSQMPLVL